MEFTHCLCKFAWPFDLFLFSAIARSKYVSKVPLTLGNSKGWYFSLKWQSNKAESAWLQDVTLLNNLLVRKCGLARESEFSAGVTLDLWVSCQYSSWPLQNTSKGEVTSNEHVLGAHKLKCWNHTSVEGRYWAGQTNWVCLHYHLQWWSWPASVHGVVLTNSRHQSGISIVPNPALPSFLDSHTHFFLDL